MTQFFNECQCRMMVLYITGFSVTLYCAWNFKTEQTEAIIKRTFQSISLSQVLLGRVIHLWQSVNSDLNWFTKKDSFDSLCDVLRDFTTIYLVKCCRFYIIIIIIYNLIVFSLNLSVSTYFPNYSVLYKGYDLRQTTAKYKDMAS